MIKVEYDGIVKFFEDGLDAKDWILAILWQDYMRSEDECFYKSWAYFSTRTVHEEEGRVRISSRTYGESFQVFEHEISGRGCVRISQGTRALESSSSWDRLDRVLEAITFEELDWEG